MKMSRSGTKVPYLELLFFKFPQNANTLLDFLRVSNWPICDIVSLEEEYGDERQGLVLGNINVHDNLLTRTLIYVCCGRVFVQLEAPGVGSGVDITFLEV